jgi:hypothetical protein
MNINAEGEELVLRNDNGDIAIIPKVHRDKALQYLKQGNHSALDDLIEGLPLMEDYAEDGTLLANLTSPEEPTEPTGTEKKKRGLFSSDEYADINNKYLYGKFTSYNPSKGLQCTGTSCRNFQQLYPEYTSTYQEIAELQKEKKLPSKVVTPSSKITDPEYVNKKDGSGVDAWDIHRVYINTGKGKSLFEQSYDNPNREKEVTSMDYKSFPVGTLLGHGSARGKFVDPDATDYAGNKVKELPRHLSVVQGFVEGYDSEGNQVTDILIDDLGSLKRVGNSVEAQETWKDYSKEITAITSRNELEGTDYYSLKGIDSPEKAKQKQKEVLDKMNELSNPAYKQIKSKKK